MERCASAKLKSSTHLQPKQPHHHTWLYILKFIVRNVDVTTLTMLDWKLFPYCDQGSLWLLDHAKNGPYPNIHLSDQLSPWPTFSRWLPADVNRFK